MLPVSDLYHTDPAQHPIRAAKELYNLCIDRYLSNEIIMKIIKDNVLFRAGAIAINRNQIWCVKHKGDTCVLGPSWGAILSSYNISPPVTAHPPSRRWLGSQRERHLAPGLTMICSWQSSSFRFLMADWMPTTLKVVPP